MQGEREKNIVYQKPLRDEGGRNQLPIPVANCCLGAAILATLYERPIDKARKVSFESHDVRK